MNLATGIQKAIDYIEAHITDELNMAEVAKQAACFRYTVRYHRRRIHPQQAAHTCRQ